MRNFSSAYGVNKNKFGHADYYEALKIGTPSEAVSYTHLTLPTIYSV